MYRPACKKRASTLCLTFRPTPTDLTLFVRTTFCEQDKKYKNGRSSWGEQLSFFFFDAFHDRGALLFFFFLNTTPQFGSSRHDPDQKLILPRKIQNCYDPGWKTSWPRYTTRVMHEKIGLLSNFFGLIKELPRHSETNFVACVKINAKPPLRSSWWEEKLRSTSLFSLGWDK